MNSPAPHSSKPAVHPLIIAAAIAVLLFCGVGIAAVMGWLPSSNGGGSGALTPSDQLASAPAAVAASITTPAPAAAPVAEPAPRPIAHHNDEPVRSTACANCGVVESVRDIATRGDGSGVGAAGGAVVGGLLGNQVGSGHGRQLATIAGAIGGAVAGNQIEGRVKTSHSYDVRIRLDDGAVRTIHQSEQPNWQAGDRVRVVNGNIVANH